MEAENANNPNWTTPTAITEMPELMPWEAPYVTHFFRLSNSRQLGMSLGPIPISEILAYCEFFDVDDPELFLYVIQKADSAYLNEYNKKQEASTKKK